MNFSGRALTKSIKSGKSTKSDLSTSIKRRPMCEYSFKHALMSEDLPVPREPLKSTLFAPKPCTNCNVLRASLSFCASISLRSENLKGAS